MGRSGRKVGREIPRRVVGPPPNLPSPLSHSPRSHSPRPLGDDARGAVESAARAAARLTEAQDIFTFVAQVTGFRCILSGGYFKCPFLSGPPPTHPSRMIRYLPSVKAEAAAAGCTLALSRGALSGKASAMAAACAVDR